MESLNESANHVESDNAVAKSTRLHLHTVPFALPGADCSPAASADVAACISERKQQRTLESV